MGTTFYKKNYFENRKKIYIIVGIFSAIVVLSLLIFLFFSNHRTKNEKMFIGKVVKIEGSVNDIGLVEDFIEQKKIVIKTAHSNFAKMAYYQLAGECKISVLADSKKEYIKKIKEEMMLKMREKSEIAQFQSEHDNIPQNPDGGENQMIPEVSETTSNESEEVKPQETKEQVEEKKPEEKPSEKSEFAVDEIAKYPRGKLVGIHLSSFGGLVGFVISFFQEYNSVAYIDGGGKLVRIEIEVPSAILWVTGNGKLQVFESNLKDGWTSDDYDGIKKIGNIPIGWRFNQVSTIGKLNFSYDAIGNIEKIGDLSIKYGVINEITYFGKIKISYNMGTVSNIDDIDLYAGGLAIERIGRVKVIYDDLSKIKKIDGEIPEVEIKIVSGVVPKILSLK